MSQKPKKSIWLIFGILLLAAATASAAPPRTMRVDYFHTGNASGEVFSLDRVVLEPLPWPGNPKRPHARRSSLLRRLPARDHGRDRPVQPLT